MPNDGESLRVPKLSISSADKMSSADKSNDSVITRSPPKTSLLAPLKSSSNVSSNHLIQITPKRFKPNSDRYLNMNRNNLQTTSSLSLTSIPDCISDVAFVQQLKSPLTNRDVGIQLQCFKAERYVVKAHDSAVNVPSVPSLSAKNFCSRNLNGDISSLQQESSSSSSSENNEDRNGDEVSGGSNWTVPPKSSQVSNGTAPDSDSSSVTDVNKLWLPVCAGKQNPGHATSVLAETEEERSKNDGAVSGKKKQRTLIADCSNTRYDIVRQSAMNVGFTVSEVEDKTFTSFLVWHDSAVSNERIAELQPFQRINHFPGMIEICRKDNLARNMARMTRAFPNDYNFIPRTWVIPSEYVIFQCYVKDLKKKKRSKTFILKPPNGAMGNGIMLCKNMDKIQFQSPVIIQEYIEKPLLVDGFKCDLRIYVLITSCDPLHAFLFHDGILRMGTEKYVSPTEANLSCLYMHLTNYSVNKHSDSYERGEAGSTGSKRNLTFLREHLQQNNVDWMTLWQDITDVIIKTLIMAHPHIYHAYRMCRPGQPPGADSVCFEVLGFDVLIDRKMKPWLLEINRAPSFGTDEEVDHRIKSAVLEDAFRLLNIRSKNKQRNLAEQKAETRRRLLRPTFKKGEKSEGKKQLLEERKEELTSLLYRLKKEGDREEFERKHCGRYQRIFPPEDRFTKEKYNKLLLKAHGIFQTGSQGQALQDILKFYSNNLKDYEIEEQILQCKAEEQQFNNMTTINNSITRKPKKEQEQERNDLILYSRRASRSRINLK